MNLFAINIFEQVSKNFNTEHNCEVMIGMVEDKMKIFPYPISYINHLRDKGGFNFQSLDEVNKLVKEFVEKDNIEQLKKEHPLAFEWYAFLYIHNTAFFMTALKGVLDLGMKEIKSYISFEDFKKYNFSKYNKYFVNHTMSVVFEKEQSCDYGNTVLKNFEADWVFRELNNKNFEYLMRKSFTHFLSNMNLNQVEVHWEIELRPMISEGADWKIGSTILKGYETAISKMLNIKEIVDNKNLDEDEAEDYFNYQCYLQGIQGKEMVHSLSNLNIYLDYLSRYRFLLDYLVFKNTWTEVANFVSQVCSKNNITFSDLRLFLLEIKETFNIHSETDEYFTPDGENLVAFSIDRKRLLNTFRPMHNYSSEFLLGQIIKDFNMIFIGSVINKDELIKNICISSALQNKIDRSFLIVEVHGKIHPEVKEKFAVRMYSIFLECFREKHKKEMKLSETESYVQKIMDVLREEELKHTLKKDKVENSKKASILIKQQKI